MFVEKDALTKVCGITRQQDADLCVELDADLVGFVFHPESPRCITPEAVRAIETPGLMRTGVFVNQTADEVRLIMQRARLDVAQLHGGQDEAFCTRVGRSRVIKVLWPATYATRSELEDDMRRFAHCSRFMLFDAGTSGGGSGATLDWKWLAGTPGIKTWFVAGGLGPDTLAEAIRQCNPCGVDLNSGVESAPGIKDEARLRACFRILGGDHRPM
ncbi:phosphoribosylanthranilate isomerase [Oleidesulfovibrio alaskensis]|jgi:phosphoribosylanthranilate isomerase|uniref:phosphoribosylanthranilate isomerase n=1 Tax=Oleidesulfovibrio alaskensis TaxID=58180 RepID=UPI001A53BF5C|nr:phosphoribosylanthranilate isomerase [Oleidesulfovibrio alaskensis]MBL3583733.1 phosphoribosylanthranilate isomerase [Oleidesulfovibrio alaskensis]